MLSGFRIRSSDASILFGRTIDPSIPMHIRGSDRTALESQAPIRVLDQKSSSLSLVLVLTDTIRIRVIR